jgi:hypothetical protein
MIKGCSTTWPPSQPSKTKLPANNQKNNLKIGLNRGLLTCGVYKKGIKKNTIRAKPIQATPPNLLGIDLKIA